MNLDIQKNNLHYYIDLLRDKNFYSCGKAMNNILRTMKLSRHSYICGEDFSHIDFGNIPMNEINFSLNGNYASSFENCTLHEANFMSGHSGPITSAVYSPDGKYILTCSVDYTAIIWEVESGLMRYILKGHKSYIITSVFSTNSKLCLTGSTDGTAILWNVETGLPLHKKTLMHKPLYNVLNETNREYWVSIVVFFSNDKLCLTGSLDRHVMLWDVNSGNLISESYIDTYIFRRIFSETCPTLYINMYYYEPLAFSLNGENRLSVSDDNTAILLNYKTTKVLRGHTARITSVAFSPDNKTCITGSLDNTAILWNVKTGKQISKLTGHKGKIDYVSFSSDSKICLTYSSHDWSTILWDVNSGSILHILPHKYRNDIFIYGHHLYIPSFTFSPDVKTCLTYSSDHSVFLWNIIDGKLLHEPSKSYNAKITSVSFSSNNKTFFTILDTFNSIKLFNLKNIKPLYEKKEIKCASFSPDGKKLLILPKWSAPILVNAETGNPENILLEYKNSFTDIAFAPNSKTCITISDMNSIILWDVETGVQLYRPLIGHKRKITSFSFSYDSKILLTCSDDSSIILWNLETGKTIHPPLRKTEKKIILVTFSPDSKTFLTGSDDGSLLLWDVNTGEVLYEKSIGYDAITSITFSPNSKKCVASLNLYNNNKLESKLILWHSKENIISQFFIKELKLNSRIQKVRFHPNGKTCLILTNEMIIHWNTTTGKSNKIPFQIPETEAITDMDISYDASKIIAGLQSSKALLIDAHTGKVIDTFYHLDSINLNNCNFKNVQAEDSIKKILYQNNANIEL